MVATADADRLARPRDPQLAQSQGVRAAAGPRRNRRRAAARRGDAAARGRRHVRRQRAAQGPNRGGGDRPPGDRRRFRDRVRGARRPAGGALGPVRRRARRPTSRTSTSCSPRRPRGAGCGTSARSRSSIPGPGGASVPRGQPGALAEAPRGSGGFGYDPAFLPDEYGHARTMAELTDDEKDRISHRGRALAAFLKWLQAGREPVR